MLYNPSKQETNIPKNDFVNVSGGRIEFTYRFNYTKKENGGLVLGSGYGTLICDM